MSIRGRPDACYAFARSISADGYRPRFDDNACVLLNNKGDMIGTRVNGVVAAELRDTQGGPGGAGRWGKIVGLAGKVR